ncbi:MAG: hypothetical protein HQ481_02360 [Alphaproteobacteria bacterium]|nr:hypothetical protein [Alphaproteobacteria bacterium]
MIRSRIFATAVLIALATPAANAAQHMSPESMQQRMQQMQTMMDQAPQAMTPEARQKLMSEHMALMQEHMAAMRGSMGPHGMMGQGKPSAMPDMTVPQKMELMQRRIDMMQQMMEQMLKQQQLQMKPVK